MATQTVEPIKSEWTLTDEQFEQAARRVCKLTGNDPDEQIQAPSLQQNGIALMVYQTEPQWRAIERQLRLQFAMMGVLMPYLLNEG